MDTYFVLKSDRPMEENQNSRSLSGFKDSFMNDLGRIPPTEISVKNRHMEWLIQNNEYNQAIASSVYSHFTAMKAGEETKVPKVIKMPGLPEVTETVKSPAEKIPGILEENKPNPMETKQLKADISEKITELGVKVPKNSTLKSLQELLIKAEAGL